MGEVVEEVEERLMMDVWFTFPRTMVELRWWYIVFPRSRVMFPRRVGEVGYAGVVFPRRVEWLVGAGVGNTAGVGESAD